MGVGGAPLGNQHARLDEVRVRDTFSTAWRCGLRYFDTAPWYGRGLSEHRFGDFLRERPQGEFTVSTKVGRLLEPTSDPRSFSPDSWPFGLKFDVVWDYSRVGVLRSHQDSLQRLGLPAVDALVIHDLDPVHHPGDRFEIHLRALAKSGWRALEDLRSSGVVGAIGAGVNEIGMIPRLLDLCPLDFVLIAKRYTLMEQGVLDSELPLCARHRVAVVVGAVFNTGLLATGPIADARYNYSPAAPGQVEAARRIQAVCQRHGVALSAVALQFPFGHPAIVAVIPGVVAPEEVISNVEAMQLPIPSDLWDELKAEGLLRSDAPVPSGGDAPLAHA